MLAGTLALNALFPVRPPAGQPEQRRQRLAQLDPGRAKPGQPVRAGPGGAGHASQSPFYAAKPYTEIVGDDQYLRLLFCLGYGPLAIEDMQIGETPLTDPFRITRSRSARALPAMRGHALSRRASTSSAAIARLNDRPAGWNPHHRGRHRRDLDRCHGAEGIYSVQQNDRQPRGL
jgi:hypothetical protein